MANRLVSVDENLDFPEAVAARQAERLRDTATPEGKASTTAAAGTLDALRRRLDIWPAFDLTGGNADSWDATTYLNYLAGIDSMMEPAISRGQVERKQYGTANNGEPLVRFTAGPLNAPHMFLGGGMHGIELVANHAALRFFQQFVYSDHPAMVTLRNRIRITWVPASNPSSYRFGRNSSTGVDINRNFPFNWGYYDNADPDRYKGPNPLSEPESAALVALFDQMDFSAMFDCHCVGASAQPQFSIAPGGTWLTTNRALPHAVLGKWAQVYNTDKAVTYGELGDGNGGDPTFKMWAAWRLRWADKKENSFSMTVEASDRLLGSTATLTTRDALRLYCGYITLLLADWLDSGHIPPTPPTMTLWATTNTNPDAAPGTAIADKGQWVKSNTSKPLAWQGASGSSQWVSGTRKTYLDFPVKNPGTVQIEATGYLQAQDGMVEDSQAEFYLGCAPSPVSGGDVSQNPASMRRVIVPGSNKGFSQNGVPFQVTLTMPIYSVPNDNLYRVQLFVRRTTGTSSHVFTVQRAQLVVKLDPSTVVDPLPLVNRKV